jgi:IPT/TIG domain
MFRISTTILLMTATVGVLGCGSGITAPEALPSDPYATTPSTPAPTSSNAPTRPVIATPSITSVSPATVVALAGDVTVTITGSNFQQSNEYPIHAFALWAGLGARTPLFSRLISDTQIVATVPADLLCKPGSARLQVVNGDSMSWFDGYEEYPQSNAVELVVAAPR